MTDTDVGAKTYRVKEFIDANQLKTDMSYSLADLSTAMMNQASLLVHYGVIASKASRQVDDLKLLLETTEAAAYRTLRDGAVKAGSKITESQLEKDVALSSTVIGIKKCLSEAKQIENLTKTAVEALRHRRDMLVQHGLITREEMKGDISINRRNAADEERRELEERVLSKMQRRE